MKVCISCNQETDNFSKDSRRKDGLYSRCKPCFAAYSKERAAKNPYKIREINKKCYEKNKHNRTKSVRTKEQTAIYNKRNIDKNPEKAEAYNYMKRRVEAIKGKERHHYSYHKDNWLDIIYLSKVEHKLLHSYMEYNKDTLAYTTLKSDRLPKEWQGIELDTKEKHLKFIAIVVGNSIL